MGLLVSLLILIGAGKTHAQVSVNLIPSLPSGQPVGTEMVLWATAESPDGAQPVFQFSVRPAGEDWRIVSDFNIWPVWEWAALEEGYYDLRVIGLVPESGESGEKVIPFQIFSRARRYPVVTAASHPLVALYSAPACLGGTMWVRYRPLEGTFWQTTAAKPCNLKSLNFYVAGMRPNTTYILQQERWVAGGVDRGPMLFFRTGFPDAAVRSFRVTTPLNPDISWPQEVLLLTPISTLFDSPRDIPTAADIGGRLIWYYNERDAILRRPVEGGTMLLTTRQIYKDRILREIDLAGNTVRETNAGQVSSQLIAMGQDPINSFHHEALRLPNGHTVVIGSVERILTDVQGAGPVDVLGDMIIDLDENFQVTWAWNAFDFLDPYRTAIMGEICRSEGLGCPPVFLAETANDWLHSNSLYYDPRDGSLLLSIRHQDWVIKIDFQDGNGSGEVLWKLGADGDFDLIADDPWPWFSHQHDARMYGDLLTLYDNGNTRVLGPGGIGGNSRGQVWLLDEETMTAALVHNFDLGHYATALGSAQQLDNGNYHFNSGVLLERFPMFSQSLEVTPTGEEIFVFELDGAVYRSFRMESLYRP
jgi:hypothetical protein